MQVVLSIREGRLSSTLLLRRLGTESHENMYKAGSPPVRAQSSRRARYDARGRAFTMALETEIIRRVLARHLGLSE